MQEKLRQLIEQIDNLTMGAILDTDDFAELDEPQNKVASLHFLMGLEQIKVGLRSLQLANEHIVNPDTILP